MMLLTRCVYNRGCSPDDNVVLSCDDNREQMFDKLQKATCHINIWFSENCMKMNTAKYQLI